MRMESYRPQKNQNNQTWIIAGVVVVALVAIVYFVWSKNDEPKGDAALREGAAVLGTYGGGCGGAVVGA